MPQPPQTFENHTRWVPPFHFGVIGALVLNLLWSIVRLFQAPGIDAAVGLLLACALLGIVFYMRVFALTVQDRVIRLEMRLRLLDLLPPDLRARMNELTRNQYVALRFASDAELPELVREVLDGKIRDRTAIKRKIRTWQPDYFRA
jgi:Family of unknown function (DUF6526)